MQEEEARELLAKYLKEDDQVAFAKVYEEIQKRCRKMLGTCFPGVHSDEIEECVQQGMLHLVSRMRDRSFIPDTPLSYMAMAVRNTRLKRIRKKGREPVAIDVMETVEVATPGDHCQADYFHAIEVFADLATIEKEILYERYVLGMTWREIGKAHGCHHTHAMTWGRSAIAHLEAFANGEAWEAISEKLARKPSGSTPKRDAEIDRVAA